MRFGIEEDDEGCEPTINFPTDPSFGELSTSGVVGGGFFPNPNHIVNLNGRHWLGWKPWR